MSYDDSNRMTGRYRGADITAVDAGLRAHMLRVYNYMAGGLAVTGMVAYGSAASGFYQSIAGTPLNCAARMDATLMQLARHPLPQTIRVAGWDGGGAVPGRGSLFDAILTAAGGVNIAATTSGSIRPPSGGVTVKPMRSFFGARLASVSQGSAGVGGV